MDDRISSDESVLLSKSGEESSTNVENTAEGSRVPTRTSFFLALVLGERQRQCGFSTLSAFFSINKYLDYLQVLAGTALALAIFADAITDPLIGALSDRFRSRFGRRHPSYLPLQSRSPFVSF